MEVKEFDLSFCYIIAFSLSPLGNTYMAYKQKNISTYTLV